MNGLAKRMEFGLQGMLKTHRQHVLRLNNSLEQLNPKNVLARGYAMVYNKKNEIVHSSKQIKLADTVEIHFAIGKVNAEISKLD
jgi:exodeoxyribonuclease VII large subunit